MTQLNELKIMNDTMILYLKKLGISYERNEIIRKLLNDDACFFKMDKDDALLILDEIGIKDNIEVFYSKLISSDVYYDLYQKGKISENDSELVITYKIYDSEHLFKNQFQSTHENVYTDTSLVKLKEKNFFQKLFEKVKSFFKKI